MKTNSFQQLSGVTLRSEARNYWFAIVDAMTTMMELENRADYVKSFNYDKEQNKLALYFDRDKSDETMKSQIAQLTRIDIGDIVLDYDDDCGKALQISCDKYDNATMEMAESIATLYGYCVPKGGRYFQQLKMKQLPRTREAINTALDSDYEEEDVLLNGNKIGKCVKRNLDKCIIELDEKAICQWNEKKLIKEGMKVGFGNCKKNAQIDCFRHSLKRLFGEYNAPAPENSRLAYFMFDTTLACPIEVAMGNNPQSELMNEEQATAVEKALRTEDISIIQGPAGTGKTTVIEEIVKRMLDRNPYSRILIASQTNVAVDNAIERLSKKESIHPLRIGRLNKIDAKTRQYCYQLINDWAEGKSNETCAADKNPKEIKGLCERAECRRKYLRSVNVFGSTCCSSGMGSMRRAYNEVFEETGASKQPWFDTVIIDEASKATLLDMAIPMVMAKHIILIGDHKQLPPYCDKEKSRLMLGLTKKSYLTDYMYDEKNKEMKPSQFERMITRAKKSNSSIVTTLRKQYRMHEQIMKLLERFYREEGGLICGVKDEDRQHGLRFANWLSEDVHTIFVNINGVEENSGTSYVNKMEEEAIRKITKALQMSAIVNGKEMPETGIISFYKSQAKRFEDIDGVMAATVDKFQGAEKDVIILSTVRSNRLGFIEDRRRLNVALSRARRLLIVVGNEKLLRENDDYSFILDNMTVIDYAEIEDKLPR